MTSNDRSGHPDDAIAVDLGATNLRVGLVNDKGEIGRMSVSAIPRDLPDAGCISSLIIRTIHSLVPDQELNNMAGIGIGVAGPVDRAHTTVMHPPNIPFDTIPLSGPIASEFGLPVRLVNDCCAGLLGEAYFGAGKGCRNFVYLTISTGIGAGIIANGNIVLGKDGNAGEVGHFFVDGEYDLTCGCGGKGHWEGYASGRFLPRFYNEWQKKNGIVPEAAHSAGEVFTLVKQNRNGTGDDFIRELGRINARGISSIIVAYDPDMIILDGSVVLNNHDLIIPSMEQYADRYLRRPLLEVSSLSGFAPLLGASIIARGYQTRFGSVE